MRKLASFEANAENFGLKDGQQDLLICVSRRDGLITYLAGSVAGCFTPDDVVLFLIKDNDDGKPSLFVKIRMMGGVERDWPCGEIIDMEKSVEWMDALNQFYGDIRHVGV